MTVIRLVRPAMVDDRDRCRRGRHRESASYGVYRLRSLYQPIFARRGAFAERRRGRRFRAAVPCRAKRCRTRLPRRRSAATTRFRRAAWAGAQPAQPSQHRRRHARARHCAPIRQSVTTAGRARRSRPPAGRRARAKSGSIRRARLRGRAERLRRTDAARRALPPRCAVAGSRHSDRRRRSGHGPATSLLPTCSGPNRPHRRRLVPQVCREAATARLFERCARLSIERRARCWSTGIDDRAAAARRAGVGRGSVPGPASGAAGAGRRRVSRSAASPSKRFWRSGDVIPLFGDGPGLTASASSALIDPRKDKSLDAPRRALLA